MTWFTEDLSISTYWSVSFQSSIKFGHGNLWIHKCKVSHFKHSGEKFILYYKCSYNMKCWQFNSWIANTFTFYKYLHMLVVLLVLARCWQINWPYICKKWSIYGKKYNNQCVYNLDMSRIFSFSQNFLDFRQIWIGYLLEF